MRGKDPLDTVGILALSGTFGASSPKGRALGKTVRSALRQKAPPERGPSDHWRYNTPQTHFVRQLPFRERLWQSGRMNALRQRVLQKSRIFCINFVRMYKISATYLDNLTKQC